MKGGLYLLTVLATVKMEQLASSNKSCSFSPKRGLSLRNIRESQRLGRANADWDNTVGTPVLQTQFTY